MRHHHGPPLWAVCLVVAAVVVLASATGPLADRSGDGGPAAPLPVVERGTEHTSHVTRTELGLQVHVLRPARLVPGSTRQLRIEVRDTTGTPIPPTLLEVDLDLETRSSVRGRIWIRPTRVLTSSRELRSQRFALGSIDALECGRDLGRLRIRVRELHENGRTGETTVQLPRVPCGSERPRTPSAAIHVTIPVCGENWREDLDALVAGGAPQPAWCRPDTGAIAPRGNEQPRSPAPAGDPEQDDHELQDAEVPLGPEDRTEGATEADGASEAGSQPHGGSSHEGDGDGSADPTNDDDRDRQHQDAPEHRDPDDRSQEDGRERATDG